MSGKKVADAILKMELILRASLSIPGCLPLYFHTHYGMKKPAEQGQRVNYLHVWIDKKRNNAK